MTQANTVHEWLAYIALLVFLGHLFRSDDPSGHPGVLLGNDLRKLPRLNGPWEHHPRLEAPTAAGRETSLRLDPQAVLGLESAALLSRVGFVLLGANVTDPVTKLLYGVTALPGTLQHLATAQSRFDLGALIWLGVVVALWYGTMRNYSLLPRVFPAPAKG